MAFVELNIVYKTVFLDNCATTVKALFLFIGFDLPQS
jgi:hypothetical protein